MLVTFVPHHRCCITSELHYGLLKWVILRCWSSEGESSRDSYSFLSDSTTGFLLKFYSQGNESTEKLHVLARDPQQVTGVISLGAQPCPWSTALLDKKCFGSRRTGMEFHTRSPQQHELHVSGDTSMCFAWLCVSDGEGWETASGSVSVPRGHNDLSNGPWPLQPGPDLSAPSRLPHWQIHQAFCSNNWQGMFLLLNMCFSRIEIAQPVGNLCCGKGRWEWYFLIKKKKQQKHFKHSSYSAWGGALYPQGVFKMLSCDSSCCFSTSCS